MLTVFIFHSWLLKHTFPNCPQWFVYLRVFVMTTHEQHISTVMSFTHRETGLEEMLAFFPGSPSLLFQVSAHPCSRIPSLTGGRHALHYSNEI